MSEYRNFTIIFNEILGPSQLSIGARYLLCLLLKHCGQDEYCYPSQSTLAKEMDFTTRYIRDLLDELINAGLIYKKRRGWNRSNTYKVAKQFSYDRKGNSYHLGSRFPLYEGNKVPPKSTYLKTKGKRSRKGLEKLNDILIKRGLKKS